MINLILALLFLPVVILWVGSLTIAMLVGVMLVAIFSMLGVPIPVYRDGKVIGTLKFLKFHPNENVDENTVDRI